MNGHWKPCIINVEVRIYVPTVRESTQNMPNSPHIANPRAPSQYNFFFLQLAAVF